MHNSYFLAVAALACAALTSGPGRSAEPTRPPDIVILLADDLGYADLGCYGDTKVQSPYLDRLAAQGVRCTDFYDSCPVCSPTRAGLMTGRYPQRNGVIALGQAPHPSEALLPQLLKKRGYATGIFGKWHIGQRKGERPTERGFDEFFGFLGGSSTYYPKLTDKSTHSRGTELVSVEGYTTDLYADAAIDFMERHRDRPFFVYLPFNAPHEPVQTAPAKYAALYPKFNEREPMDRYRTIVTALDDAIGRVLAKLDSLQLADNTLVVFISDNGGAGGSGRNKPLRGAKGGLFEGGIRVPCLVRWPGKVKPGTICREPLIQLDLFTLALVATGAPVPKPTERIIDGLDPTAALAGTAPSPHQELFWEYNGSGNNQWAIRSGRYKLVNAQEFQMRQPTKSGLFDLVDDPQESRDLTAARPEVVKALKTAFETWQKQVSRSSAN